MKKRLSEKRASIRRMSGGMNLARPFKAGADQRDINHRRVSDD
jgi:hypothetical protein